MMSLSEWDRILMARSFRVGALNASSAVAG
jgi:hypothetical protein